MPVFVVILAEFHGEERSIAAFGSRGDAERYADALRERLRLWPGCVRDGRSWEDVFVTEVPTSAPDPAAVLPDPSAIV